MSADQFTPTEQCPSVSQLNNKSWKPMFLAFLIRSVRNKSYFLFLAALVATTLFASMMADDYYLASRLQANTVLPFINDASIWNTFSVSDGRPETNAYLVQQGLMTWWTSPDFRFQMLRPLAEISHWIDFTLWPNSLEAMHLHQMIWVFLFFLVAYKFLMKFSSNLEIGALAFIFFSISANHSQTIAWLASRNTLMAGTFGVAAVLLHAKGRESGKLYFQVLALLSFSAALAASEFGLSSSVWLFAYTLFLDKGHLVKRILHLAPYGLLMLAYISVYLHWNHGVFASEFYVNPASYPLNYLVSLLEKTPTSLFNSMFHLPPAALFGSALIWSLGWFASIIILVFLFIVIRKHLKLPIFMFYTTGSLLSMIPIAAGSSGARTLAFVSLGIAPIMASVVYQWAYDPVKGKLQKSIAASFSWSVLVLSVISIGVLPTITVIYRNHNLDNYLAPANRLPIDHADKDSAVILLNPNSVFYAIFYPLARSHQGNHLPGSFYPLASSKNRKMTLLKDTESSFVLRPDGGFLIEPGAYFMRSKDDVFFEGQQISYRDLTIEVQDVLDDGRPGSIRVVYGRGLLLKNIKVLYCTEGQFLQLPMLKIGDPFIVPAC